MRKTFSVLLIISALLLPSLVGRVQAATYHQRVLVMVAADEEFIWRMRWEYGYDDWAFLADTWIYLIQDDFYKHFQIYLKVMLHTTWDSDDDLVLGPRLVEVCQETGFHSGMDVSGATIEILVAYTGQVISHEADIRGMACDDPDVPEYGSVLITIQADLTDNLVQHEITHLYGPNDHRFSIDCVMYIPGGLYTNHWCKICRETILENRDRFGEWVPVPVVGGGGGCYLKDEEAVEG